jgi:Flp pilus assembly protein TadD
MNDQVFDETGFFSIEGFDNFCRKDYQRSVVEYTKAIVLDKADAMAHFIRGIAYMELGEKSKALEDFLEAMHLGITVPQYFLTSVHGSTEKIN